MRNENSHWIYKQKDKPDDRADIQENVWTNNGKMDVRISLIKEMRRRIEMSGNKSRGEVKAMTKWG